MFLLANSDIVREVDRALILIGGMCLLLLMGITIAMIYFLIRYRRSTTPTITQIEGHFWLEITWIIVPTIIVTWMFFVGYKGFNMMRTVPDDAMIVETTGKQWMWSFHYPEEDIDSMELYVPVNTPVKVELEAPIGDVLHSFYLPDFRIKEDVVPGIDTYLWFESERTGVFNIFCAEFCGKNHSKMISLLHVVTQEEYDQWVETQRMKRYEPLVFDAVVNSDHPNYGADGLNINADLMYQTYCASCHGKNGDGSGLPGEARDFTTDSGWTRSTKVVDIYRVLTEGVPNTQMRQFTNFTPWERVGLAHQIRSYLSSSPPPDSQADYDALVAEYELDKVQAPGETIAIDKAMDILQKESLSTP